MEISSYDMVVMTLAAAEIQHPEWKKNPEAEVLLRQCCKEVDSEFLTGNYNLCADADESGNIVIAIKNPDTGDTPRVWIAEGVFVIE